MKITVDNYQKNIVSLCPVELSHKEFLLQLFKECRPDLDLIGNINEEQRDAIIAQQFNIEQEQLRKMYPDAEFNIVMVNGKPIGRLYIYYGEEFHHIIEIGLLKSYRGLGIGKKIMITAIKNATKMKKSVKLKVFWFNQGAYSFYENIGFTIIKNNTVFYEMEYRK